MLWVRLQGKHCTKLCKPRDVNIDYYKHKQKCMNQAVFLDSEQLLFD